LPFFPFSPFPFPECQLQVFLANLNILAMIRH
jgi:hypothetical protein